MVATTGKAAFGTLLKLGAVTIAEITAIEPPNMSADRIEMTNMASPDGYKEFISGLKDGGEVKLECNFIAADSTGQIALMTAFHAGTVGTYTIALPSTLASWAFSAFPADVQMKTPIDGKIGFTVTLKVTGKPALTIGA